jgi:hypothetical protein
MQSKYKVLGGSLVGAVVIHAAFVACGGMTGGGSGPGGSDGGWLDAMTDASDGGLLDAVLDVIADIVGEESHDAMAAGDAGGGGDSGGGGGDAGACGCTVSLSGPVQSVPASENSAQLQRGAVQIGPNGSFLVSGPFILTDVTTDNFQGGAVGATLVIQPSAASCPSLPGGPEGAPGYLLTLSATYETASAHGARYSIPAGQMLCAYIPPSTFGSPSGTVQWAGFVPYM